MPVGQPVVPYDESWDRPHRSGEHALWQESDCYWFYDSRQGVGGFHRIGQKPNAGTGQVTLFAFAGGGERYLSIVEFPAGTLRRSESGQRVADSSVEALGDLAMRYRWERPDSEADLLFRESFYTPRGWTRGQDRAAAVTDVTNPDGHLECSGRIEGKLRIGKREYDVRALAHRDRSWGFRDVSRVQQHRMFSGTVGPELSFATFVLQLKDAGFHASGFVVRDGREADVRDLRVLTTIDHDGLTMAGATVQMRLEDGETLEIPCSGVQGFVSDTSGYVSTDTLCEVSWNGQPGFCDLEVANNPTRGTYAPKPGDTTLACVEAGLSPAARYDFAVPALRPREIRGSGSNDR